MARNPNTRSSSSGTTQHPSLSPEQEDQLQDMREKMERGEEVPTTEMSSGSEGKASDVSTQESSSDEVEIERVSGTDEAAQDAQQSSNEGTEASGEKAPEGMELTTDQPRHNQDGSIDGRQVRHTEDESGVRHNQDGSHDDRQTHIGQSAGGDAPDDGKANPGNGIEHGDASHRSSGAGGMDEEGHRLNQDGSVDKRQFNHAPSEEGFPRNTADKEMSEREKEVEKSGSPEENKQSASTSSQEEEEPTEENTRPEPSSEEETVTVSLTELKEAVTEAAEDSAEKIFAELFTNESDENSSTKQPDNGKQAAPSGRASSEERTETVATGQSPFKTTGALKLRRVENTWVVCETENGDGGIPLTDGSGMKITGPFNKNIKMAVTEAITRMGREKGFFSSNQEFTYHGR